MRRYTGIVSGSTGQPPTSLIDAALQKAIQQALTDFRTETITYTIIATKGNFGGQARIHEVGVTISAEPRIR
jgi:hypothetical protein